MWAVCSPRRSRVSPWMGALSSQPSLWEGTPHSLQGWGYSRVCHPLPLLRDTPACCNNGTRKWGLLQQLLMHWCLFYPFPGGLCGLLSSPSSPGEGEDEQPRLAVGLVLSGPGVSGKSCWLQSASAVGISGPISTIIHVWLERAAW